MTGAAALPVGVKLHSDIERRPGADGDSYRARVRWYDPTTRKRRSKSETFSDDDAAQGWIDNLRRAAAGGVDPERFTQTLHEYGDSVMRLALRGLEAKTTGSLPGRLAPAGRSVPWPPRRPHDHLRRR
jgi:hypothetical protein